MRTAPLLTLLLLTACAEMPVEVLEAPPHGWTEVTADLPGFSGQRTYLTYGDGITSGDRETHLFLAIGDHPDDLREVLVTIFGEPGLVQRSWRWTANEPLSLNRSAATIVQDIAPETLGLSSHDAETAYAFFDAQRGVRGTVVRACEVGRCYEIVGGGPDDGSPEAEANYTGLVNAVQVGG
ncbi:MAG: hypothetical protein AAGI52_13550 [Bacteroidota bacterium]